LKQVSEDSPLVGKTLREAKIADETSMRILVIKRGKRWLCPRPAVTIESGDLLIASGYAEGEEDLMLVTRRTHSGMKKQQ